MQHIRLYRHAMHEMKAVLEWLWDVAVSPVLDELGFIQVPDGEAWPRVWWVGSGLLGILPIHAAGYHDSPLSKATLDRVISLYASSVKSLSYSREKAARKDTVTLKKTATLVAMPLHRKERVFHLWILRSKI